MFIIIYIYIYYIYIYLLYIYIYGKMVFLKIPKRYFPVEKLNCSFESSDYVKLDGELRKVLKSILSRKKNTRKGTEIISRETI